MSLFDSILPAQPPEPLRITTSSPLPEATVGVAYSASLSAAGGVPGYTYSITGGSLPAGLSLSAAGVVGGTPLPGGRSNSTIQVKVTDSVSATASRAFTLTLRPAPPSITTGSPLPDGTVGVGYNLALSATGGTPGYTYLVTGGATPAGLSLSAAGVLSGTPSAAGGSSFTVQVTDSASATAPKIFSLTIKPAPSITTSSSLPDGTVGVAYNLALSATGGTPGYSYLVTGGATPAGLSLSAAGVLSGTPLSAGGSSFTVQVTDSASATAPKIFSLTIKLAPTPLSVTTSSPLPQGTVGVAYSVALAATGGAPGYTFAIAGGSSPPPGLSLSSSGLLTGTPTTAGTFSFSVAASDTQSSVSPAKPLDVTIVPALTITSPPSLPGGTATQPYSYSFVPSGGTGPYTWSISKGTLPAGITLNPADGTLKGTPTEGGTFQIEVRVTDSLSQTAASPFTLNIILPPTISTKAIPGGTISQPYRFTFAATNGTPPYRWQITAGVPPGGISLSSAGVLEGTPSSAGPSTLTIRVTDAAGVTDSVTVSFTISSAPLTVTTSAVLPEAIINRPYSASLSAKGGTPPFSWSLASGSLPGGLTLTSPGEIRGTPTALGNFDFTVQLTDSNPLAPVTTAPFPFRLAVSPPPLEIITSSQLPEGAARVAYTFALTATGGRSTIVWSVISGSLPPGFGLNSATGVITGNSTVAGTYNFSVQARDDGGPSSVRAFVLVIRAGAGAGTAISVTTPALLPEATINRPYSVSFSAEGGIPPYVWSLDSGSLPSGLALTSPGEIRGIPTALGAFDFTVRIADSTPPAATTTARAAESGANRPAAIAGPFPFRLAVIPPPVEITTASPLPAAGVGVPYSIVLVATGSQTGIVFAIVSGALPPGLSLNSSTGAISGTATLAGTYEFTVQARDNSGPSSLERFVLSVPGEADLVLSAYSAVFNAAAGGAAPPAQSISVASRLNSLTAYRVTADAAPWLRVISGAEASTPGRIILGVNAASLDPGSYRATIRVESVTTRQVIAVPISLEVTATRPSLEISPSYLRLDRGTPGDNPAPLVQVRNTGIVSLDFTATVVEGASYITVQPTQGTLRPGDTSAVRILYGPTIPSGFTRAVIRFRSDLGTTDIPVSIANPSTPRMLRLEPEGTLVNARQDNGASRGTRSFSVLNQGSVPVDYTTQVVSESPWLRVDKSSGSIPAAGADAIDFTADPGSLRPGAYYGRIRVNAPSAPNTPLDFIVVLRVVSSDQPPLPELDPSGLVFTAPEGGSAPRNQSVQIYTSSLAGVPYQASVYTEDRGDWLSVSPATGVTSTRTPATLTLRVDGSRLKRGVYTGRVNVSLSSTAVRSVQVTYVVTPAAGRTAASENSLAGCTPNRLVATHTGLAGNFSSPVAWPSPISVRLTDDCGDAVASAQVIANFSNGDPPLPLRLSNAQTGTYSATWVPAVASNQLTVTANATAPSLASTTTDIIGAAEANSAPIIGRGAVLHNYFRQVLGPLAPGNLVEILGQELAGSVATATFPAPKTLNGVTVLISGRPAPLLYVSPTQINAQIPFGLATETTYSVLVSTGQALAMPQPLDLNAVKPGIAANPDAIAIAQFADGSPVKAGAPAKAGDVITLFLAGLGATTVDVPAGSVSPADPPALAVTPVSVTIGGQVAEVAFAGLTPGLVGVYQVDLRIPEGLPPGVAEVILTQGNTLANIVRIPIGR
ncbi:MAG: putative Ig domain-containing protein [Bryobacteraceae bacterium]